MNEQEKNKSYLALTSTVLILVLIWSVQLLIDFGGFDKWRDSGVHPRDWSNFWGVFTMPFLHAKGIGPGAHIVNNTMSFAVLNTILFFFYTKISVRVWASIAVFSGVLYGYLER